MKKWIMLLSVALIAQLVITVVVYMSGEDYGAYESNENLIPFEMQSVNRIQVDDGSSEVVLEKKNETWQLPQLEYFLADQHLVGQLLEKLAAMKRGWPVATTSGASRRFKVDEKLYERSVKLFKGDNMLGQVLIGNSPGFRRVHIRNVQEDEVYAVEFNSWEVGAELDDWVDKNVLAFSEEKLLRIDMADFSLQREGDEIQLVDKTDQEEVDQKKIQSLVDNLSGLPIESVFSVEEEKDVSDDVDLQFTVTLEPENALVYQLFKMNDQAYFLLKRSDFDHSFKLSEFHVKPIKEITRKQLLVTENEHAHEHEHEHEDEHGKITPSDVPDMED